MKPSGQDAYHQVFVEFLALTQSIEAPSILEIGSRNVIGVTRRHLFPHCADYVGFDIMAGPGVDVIGDAHALSSVFPAGRFEFAYAVSVFEHLLFPWKVVLEINEILKPGGYVYVSTHPVWPEHEMPWDFWRFPQNAFRALFNRFTGFEIISLIEGLPCLVYSLVDDASTMGSHFGNCHQAVGVIARKTHAPRDDLLRWDIGPSDVIDTMYPGPQE